MSATISIPPGRRDVGEQPRLQEANGTPEDRRYQAIGNSRHRRKPTIHSFHEMELGLTDNVLTRGDTGPTPTYETAPKKKPSSNPTLTPEAGESLQNKVPDYQHISTNAMKNFKWPEDKSEVKAKYEQNIQEIITLKLRHENKENSLKPFKLQLIANQFSKELSNNLNDRINSKAESKTDLDVSLKNMIDGYNIYFETMLPVVFPEVLENHKPLLTTGLQKMIFAACDTEVGLVSKKRNLIDVLRSGGAKEIATTLIKKLGESVTHSKESDLASNIQSLIEAHSKALQKRIDEGIIIRPSGGQEVQTRETEAGK